MPAGLDGKKEMSEDIKKLGELFKAKRKELNLSLKEVESSTSIRVSYLEAIEEGKEEKFLSSVYTLGFIKQYANFLGLDGEKVLQEHAKFLSSNEEARDFAYGIGTLEVRGNVGSGNKWLPNFFWIIGFLVVLPLATYYLFKYFGWI